MTRISKALAVVTCLLAGTAMAQVGYNDTLADPNLAEAEALAALPNMTEALAETVVDNRPYLSAQALDDVLAESLDRDQRNELYGALFRQVNLNDASDEEMLLIPGMNWRMAHEFKEYRPYRSLEQFRREIGKYVDDDELARFERYVFVPLNLNTASEDDLATIPGMTPRMVHEFEEYRPYTNMEQFRREIGKYVDVDEVARLESYVTID